MTKKPEKHEFQSEAKQVLDLMIHSVYSNPDIFLRELISNASDALDKLRIEGLSNPELAGLSKDGKITITVDKESKTLNISDNGIGMERGELISYLGTIARSGTKEFLRAMKEAAAANNSDLIGQFGIGFYSSFIVAGKVRVTTRKAGREETLVWESEGDGTYTIAAGTRETNGTDVKLYLNETEGEHARDYSSEWELRSIIKKYSDFVTYPIYIEDSGKEDDGGEKEPVNSMKALWTRAESEVSDEEYDEFYKHISRDWESPMERVVYKGEGTSEFRALLYIPQRPPVDLFYQEGKHGVQLYIKRVFIMSDCRELIPEYLRFIKGVVDSEDLSLNVSREILQQDRQTAMIKNSLTRKILDSLKKLKQDKPGEYAKFWRMFGPVLKEGIISDGKNRETLLKLCLLDNSNGETVSLEQYVASMRDGQKDIYYITGTNIDNLKNSPKLEAFRKKNLEVLLLGDAIDEIWVNTAQKFGEYPFMSIASENLALPEGDVEENGEEREKLEKTGVAGKLKEALGDLVEDVKISSRLVHSPVTFVQKGDAMSAQMRKFFKAMGQETPQEKKVLEINPSHPLIKKAAASVGEDRDAGEWAAVLMGLASISDGEPVENGKDFTEKLTSLLEN